jgi:hypothetical protein
MLSQSSPISPFAVGVCITYNFDIHRVAKGAILHPWSMSSSAAKTQPAQLSPLITTPKLKHRDGFGWAIWFMVACGIDVAAQIAYHHGVPAVPITVAESSSMPMAVPHVGQHATFGNSFVI